MRIVTLLLAFAASLAFGAFLYQQAVVEGAFGPAAEGWVRISFTIGDDDLLEGCRRIVEFVSNA